MPRSSLFRIGAPSTSLPPLSRLSLCSTDQIQQALLNLHAIYRPESIFTLSASTGIKPSKRVRHLIHDSSVPDSGYASAEEDEEAAEEEEVADEHGLDTDIDILRSDVFEREYAVRWLTAFAARSDMWVGDPLLLDEAESEVRAQLVDNAASLLATFAGEDKEEALDRTFTFARRDAQGEALENIEIELNDAPLLSEDHTSVGLQSWGSSIILAERMCASPAIYGLCPEGARLRVLELGAGTGLLSITAAKLLQDSKDVDVEIVATDYHPSVLENLATNVNTNFPPSSFSPSPVTVTRLDWQKPDFDAPLDKPFDLVLAADVIYHPEHAQWIKACVERLLARPHVRDVTDGRTRPRQKSVFWLIIPLRSTGRHAGMGDTVDDVFPRAAHDIPSTFVEPFEEDASLELAILRTCEMGKLGGIGRADEGGYTLYEIGWMPAARVAGH